MAGDFHAVAGLQGAIPSPLQDEALAATEGGFLCNQDRIQEGLNNRLVMGNLGARTGQGSVGTGRTGQGSVGPSRAGQDSVGRVGPGIGFRSLLD